MKRLAYLLFSVMLMLVLPGCNDDPDFIKNAPPAAGNGNENTDDDEISDDLEEGVDPNFQIYICFGQSNMEGFAQWNTGYNGIEEVDKTVDERFKTLCAVSDNAWSREFGKWYIATPPLCRPGTGLCPADYFGRTMVEKLSEDNPDIKIGVIVVAMGGAPIRAFHKTEADVYYKELVQGNKAWEKGMMDAYGGNPYNRMVELAKIAQKKGVIKGILMHQGESDGCGKDWRKRVSEIYNSLIADLELKAERTPLLVGELLNDNGKGLGVSRNADLLKISELVPNTYVVSSEGCTVAEVDVNDKGENNYLHFSPDGYRKLGRNYAETMLSVLAGQKPDEPEEPIEPTDPTDLFKIEDGKFKNLSTYHVPDVAIDYGSKTVSNIGDYGVAGWQFATPVNLKGQGFLVAKFTASDDAVPFLCIGNMDAYGEAYAQYGSTKKDGYYYSVIDLKNDLVSNVNNDKEYSKGTVYLDKLTMVGLQCPASGQNHSFTIESVYVSDKNPLDEGGTEEPGTDEMFGLGSLDDIYGSPTIENNKVSSTADGDILVGWIFNGNPQNLENKGYLVAEISSITGDKKPHLYISNDATLSYNVYNETNSSQDINGVWYSVIDLNNETGTVLRNNIQQVGLRIEGATTSTSFVINRVYISDTNPLEGQGGGEEPLPDDEPEQGTSVPVSNECFDLSTLNSDLEGFGRGTWDSGTGKLTTSKNGIGGWKFNTPVDFTAHKYIVVEFKEAPTIYCLLAFYSDGYSVYDYSYTQEISGKRVVFDTTGTYETKKFQVTETKTLDLKNIKMFGIQTGGDSNGLYINRIYVTDTYPDEN